MEKTPSKTEQAFSLLILTFVFFYGIVALKRRIHKSQPTPVYAADKSSTENMPAPSSLELEFSRLRSAWEASQGPAALRAILQRRTNPIDIWIGIGLGSFQTHQTIPSMTRPGESIRALLPSKRRLAQLVIFCEIAQILFEERITFGVPTRRPFRFCAQDPNFTGSDVGFLASLGITVIKNAANLIGPSTGAFCPYLVGRIDIRVIAKSPGLYIGYSLSRRIQRSNYLGREHPAQNKAERELLLRSVETAFPVVDGDGWWGPSVDAVQWERRMGEKGDAVKGMCLYWPR
ncbi:uncharacterized protein BDZ99DRAFT_476535 [Mytilinidion resinicola]|uniref:SRR1-like domain-containing protein n=1 Tax=Mytilinidion resinicola TaxID=574789 RepID=A0A6A6YQS6_9PEZI|nr:uncharacterized protein BDZ99DRAFT_476535 [Mytilinidion resinicola]KAF2810364.1 hypothetical protein BDZ99DRAFT_476535 [Mytilinidion resinicola]